VPARHRLDLEVLLLEAPAKDPAQISVVLDYQCAHAGHGLRKV
jgi:hypothetical protein